MPAPNNTNKPLILESMEERRIASVFGFFTFCVYAYLSLDLTVNPHDNFLKMMLRGFEYTLKALLAGCAMAIWVAILRHYFDDVVKGIQYLLECYRKTQQLGTSPVVAAPSSVTSGVHSPIVSGTQPAPSAAASILLPASIPHGNGQPAGSQEFSAASGVTERSESSLEDPNEYSQDDDSAMSKTANSARTTLTNNGTAHTIPQNNGSHTLPPALRHRPVVRDSTAAQPVSADTPPPNPQLAARIIATTLLPVGGQVTRKASPCCVQ